MRASFFPSIYDVLDGAFRKLCGVRGVMAHMVVEREWLGKWYWFGLNDEWGKNTVV